MVFLRVNSAGHRAAIRAVLAKTPTACIAARYSHSLQVPPVSLNITAFENGVPVDQVRALSPPETNWDFWTTSDAFTHVKPTLGGYSYVPYGEVWITGSGASAKAHHHGHHFFVPFISRVTAIKTVFPVSMGVLTNPVKTKDGVSVNGYAVLYFQVKDPVQSAFYHDPETNKLDSEAAAAKTVRKIMEQELANVSVGESKVLSQDISSTLSQNIMSKLKAKSSEYALDIHNVEIRTYFGRGLFVDLADWGSSIGGAFPTSFKLRDKLRALDPPLLLPDTPGHGLSADYWAEVLAPPYFFKYKYGSEKEVVTPAAVSLEWSIPSPPDYHHFNMIPRLTVDAPTSDKVVKAH
ncbi:hypothetical protein HK101_011313 [Irineochytrium annulatum]|nr:hypothetical protein HK101_011313 [Irineochytrium annulatum]